MKGIYFSMIAAIAIIAVTVLVTGRGGSDAQKEIRIAYPGSPHLAPLYAAFEQGIFEKKGLPVKLEQFGSSTHAGFALLAGKVEVAFMEPSRSFRLINENDDLGIKIAGTVNFNFGATLVVREGLNVRLHDLEGLKIAAGSRFCVLLNQFKHDAQRYGVNTENINFVYMDFATMLPALEAGKIDGMLTRAASALPAQAYGHSVLYQNWDALPGDACCPEYLAQVEYFMLVRNIDAPSVRLLDSALTEASALPAGVSRDAIAKLTQFPPELLTEESPVAYYKSLDQALKEELGDWVWTAN